MDNEQISKIEEDIKFSFDRIADIIAVHEIGLDEEIEITKIEILYLIYNELKRINEKLDKINDGRKD